MNTDIIYKYTQAQAIEDGFLYQIAPNLIITSGVFALKGIGFDNGKADDYLFEQKLGEAMVEEYNKQPDVDTKGGNDKDFFTFTWRGTKFFVARNETNGLTIMLPEEY